MIWDDFRTVRHVLREYPAIVAVNALAERESWPLIAEDAADPERGVPYQIEWLADQTVTIDYVEDEISRTAFVYLAGRFEEDVRRAESFAVAELSPITEVELIEAVDEAESGPERGRALLRVGLGSPKEFDQEIFRRISAGLTDEDPAIRNVAIYATTYSPWSEYRSPLRRIADEDPETELRTAAAAALRAFDKGGVGDDDG